MSSTNVRPMFMRMRHYLSLLSFVVCVVLPTAAAFTYLYAVAADQYSSKVAFSVRSEELQNPLEAIESLGQISTGTSSDADILYDFILSQKLVENIKRQVDLEAIYSRPEYDPVFAYEPGQPIEELAEYWERMVDVSYDNSAGLIRLEIYAFTPEDAYTIAEMIVAESDRLVNELSQIARADTTRFAQEDLDRAAQRLKEVRLQLTTLRSEEQIIDPKIDLEIRMGVLTALQQQLAETFVQEEMLSDTTRSGDPRLDQLTRQIDALQNRISRERQTLADSTLEGNDDFVNLMGAYESLQVDLEFAQAAYLASSAAYDTALAEARRRSRYLATHIPPTFAESALYPQRALLGMAVFGACLLFWMIATFTLYAARDRG